MIKYITITTLKNQGCIFKSIQFKYVVYQMGVKYICIWKYLNTFLSICSLGIKNICI